MKTPREKNFKNRSGRRAGKAVSHDQGPGAPPFDFDLVELLAAAGANGASLPALTMMARDVTGRPELTEGAVREQLRGLMARGLVATTNGRWTIR